MSDYLVDRDQRGSDDEEDDGLNDRTRARRRYEQEQQESIGEDQEEFEDEHGYHTTLTDNRIRVVTGRILDSMMGRDPTIAARQQNDAKFAQFFTSLNRGQHKLFQNVLSRIKRMEKFYHFVTGSAGVGKSRLIETLNMGIHREIRRQDGRLIQATRVRPTDQLACLLFWSEASRFIMLCTSFSFKMHLEMPSCRMIK